MKIGFIGLGIKGSRMAANLRKKGHELMAVEAKERKVRFLDAPVAGSKGPAEQAQLLFFVGGAGADVAAAKPLL
jgi:3-hydroxyisobutyrate dehydrogenase-like beta-hydroxyacid dehydrogenase